MTDTHARRRPARHAHAPKHPYHLVDPSPWPIVGAIAAGLLATGGRRLHARRPRLVALDHRRRSRCSASMAVWWRDVIREATFRGPSHTGRAARPALRHGAVHRLGGDVLRRVLLGVLHRRRCSRRGGVWPPKGIHPFDPFDFPFLNTLILLLSGTTVTWAHHSLLEGNQKGLIQGLAVTVLLGLCSPRSRPTSTATPPSASPAASIPRPSSWRPGSTASTSSSAPASSPSACGARSTGRFHARPSFRPRGGGLVLALRRRGLAVPVRLHLLVGHGQAIPAASAVR